MIYGNSIDMCSFFWHFFGRPRITLPIDFWEILRIDSCNNDLCGLHFYVLFFTVPPVMPIIIDAHPSIMTDRNGILAAEDTTESITCKVSAVPPKASIQWFLKESDSPRILENLTSLSSQQEDIQEDVSMITLLACLQFRSALGPQRSWR